MGRINHHPFKVAKGPRFLLPQRLCPGSQQGSPSLQQRAVSANMIELMLLVTKIEVACYS